MLTISHEIIVLWCLQVPADSYMRTGRQQADAALAAYQRHAKAAEADKARAKTADARAARLVQHRQQQQQNGGLAVRSTAQRYLQAGCWLCALHQRACACGAVACLRSAPCKCSCCNPAAYVGCCLWEPMPPCCPPRSSREHIRCRAARQSGQRCHRSRQPARSGVARRSSRCLAWRHRCSSAPPVLACSERRPRIGGFVSGGLTTR